MNVLVINAGSSSLKYQLLNVDAREVFAKGNCERIGISGSFVGHSEMGGEKVETKVAFPTHKEAIDWVLDNLKGLNLQIDGIGHRVVQGGWYFPESAVVDDDVLAKVREVAPLAPLHNPCEADVIDLCRKAMPEVGNVIVCDTSFHYNMPAEAHTYALPRDVVDELHIRKYGAHGTSHRFIWRTVHGLYPETHKLVSLHLGSGASLCAIEDGACKDTTMGLTPLDGLVMGTRCGTIDPATVFYLSREGGYLIDTPGIKGFGTFDMEPEELTSYFKDIFHFSKECRFNNCTHTHEPGCAVLKAVEEHYIAASRYQSYLSMLEDKDENKYREAY